MRTNLLLVGLAIMTTTIINAQSFTKGSSVISGDIGIGSSLGFYSSSQSPALSVNFEHGTWQAGESGVVSAGAYVGRKSFTYGGNGYSEKWSYTIIGARSAYHYTGLKNEKLDIYGGVMLSYDLLSYSLKYNNGTSYSGTVGGSYGSGTGFTGFVGGRYYVAPRVAVNTELGYGVSYLNAGISLKL